MSRDDLVGAVERYRADCGASGGEGRACVERHSLVRSPQRERRWRVSSDKKWEFSLYRDSGCAKFCGLFCRCVHIVVSERASC